MSPFQLVIRHPTLRMIGMALLFLGAMNASAFPYQSLIAIEVIGLSNPAFALLLVLASATAVTSSVLSGIMGDQHGKRRLIALIAAGASLLGLLLMLFFPSKLSLVLCHGILVPVGSSVFGQLFALARLASPDSGSRDGILGVVRAAMSLTFLAMLIFWTFAFSQDVAVTSIYITASLAALGMVVLFALSWPRDGKTTWQDQRSGLNFIQAFREIAAPHVLVRLLLLGAIGSSAGLYMTIVSLIFEAAPGRSASDVALYVGLIAGWEVPILLWILPHLSARFERSTLIAAGTAVYCCHLIALPVLAESPLIWAMTLVAGLGGTAIIALPIAYYQDLLQGRPGTAGAMLALQKLVADVLVAASFAVGTAIGGYVTVSVLGTGIAMVGAVGLVIVDRKH